MDKQDSGADSESKFLDLERIRTQIFLTPPISGGDLTAAVAIHNLRCGVAWTWLCLDVVRCSMQTRFANTAQHADAFFVIQAIFTIEVRRSQ